MKKLSELSLETMLTVKHQFDGEMDIMSKKGYLNSAYFLDYPAEPFTTVTVADKTVVRFDIDGIIERLSEDETYEDWEEDVWYDIEHSNIDIKAIEKAFNDIFENNPTYWEGEVVEIDIIPEQCEKPQEAAL
jgi:hypothetical protein